MIHASQDRPVTITHKCGETWQQDCDPVLEVECPACHAKPGAGCKRPSGHAYPMHGVHAERDLAAAAAGKYRPCPRCASAPDPAPTSAAQQTLL